MENNIFNIKSDNKIRPIAIILFNLVQFESILPGLNELKKNNIIYDIYIPKLTIDQNGFKEMYDATYYKLTKLGYHPLRKPIKNIKYKIVLSAYNPEGIINIPADYSVKFQYSFSTKPEWGFKYETNKFYDYILCYNKYDQSFYNAYAQTKIIGNIKYANYKKRKVKKIRIKKKILYLPTYGELSSIDQVINKLEKLKEKYQIAIKLHHGTSFLKNETGRLNKIHKIFEEVYTSEDVLSDLIDDADIILSDKSGAIFDSIYLEKPVVTYSNHKNYFHGILSMLDSLVEDGIIASTSNVSNLEEIIKIGLTDEYRKKQLNLKRNLFSISGDKSLKLFMNLMEKLISDKININYHLAHREIFDYENFTNKRISSLEEDILSKMKNMKTNNNKIKVISENYKTSNKENTILKDKMKSIQTENTILKDKMKSIQTENTILKNDNYLKSLHLEKIYKGKIWKAMQTYFQIRNTSYNLLRNIFKNKTISYCDESVLSKISCIKLIDTDLYYKEEQPKTKIPKFSLICTELNEEKNLNKFLLSIKKQSLQPDEFIIVDGGSTDRSIKIIKNVLKNANFTYKLIVSPGANISAGRNIALNNSNNEIVLSIDAGCLIKDKNYFKKMISPFIDTNVDLAGGITYPVSENEYTKYFIPNYSIFDYKNYLPSARSVAFKTSIAKKIGFFDEFLTTGEDTMFDILYRRISSKWVIVKDAVIYWHGPENIEKCLKLLSRYSRGDGLSGFGFFRFGYINPYKIKNQYFKAQINGFWEGVKIRIKHNFSDRIINKVVVYIVDDYLEFTNLLNNNTLAGLYRIIIIKEKNNFWPNLEVNHFDNIDFKNTDVWSNKVIRNQKDFKDVYLELFNKQTPIEYFYNNKSTSENFFNSLLSEKKWKISICNKIINKTTKNILKYLDFINVVDLIKIWRIVSNKKKIIVITPVVDWVIPLKQRYQHLSEALADKGLTVFFCTPNYNEQIYNLTNPKNNLYITNKYWFIKKVLKKSYFITYSGDKRIKYEELKKIEDKNFIIYEYIDEISEDIIGKIPSYVFTKHKNIIKNKNIYISVSANKLYEEVVRNRKQSNKVKLITNGVDITHFKSGNRTNIDDQNILNFTKNKKVIGYFGAFAKWFDYDLVLKISKSISSKYVILLIGWDYDGSMKRSGLEKRDNIKVIGPINYQNLPNYASLFDICTIPFKINNVTKSTSPIKLFEYMSLGKPIITTALPECLKYKSAMIANNEIEFIKLLNSINKIPSSYYKKLEEESIKNTWIEKAGLLLNLINNE